MTRYLTATTAKVAGILVLCVPSYLAAQPGSGVDFVAPSPGQVVRPGETVAVQVSVDPSLGADQVFLWPSFDNEEIGPIPSPYETTVTIPQREGGDIALMASAQSALDQSVFAWTEVALSVVPENPPVEMELDGSHGMVFELPSTHTQRIAGSLKYVDGYWRSLSYPAYGVTYSSDDADVAIVDSKGIVTPVAAGWALITVQAGSLEDWVRIVVSDANGPPQAIDQTANVSFARSGFRVDPSDGQLVQQVLISNVSPAPLHSPLVMVVENLPMSVHLANSKGETKDVSPAGSPYVFVPIHEGIFRPGSSVEVTLRFYDPYDVPVTYVPRIYSAIVK